MTDGPSSHLLLALEERIVRPLAKALFVLQKEVGLSPILDAALPDRDDWLAMAAERGLPPARLEDTPLPSGPECYDLRPLSLDVRLPFSAGLFGEIESLRPAFEGEMRQVWQRGQSQGEGGMAIDGTESMSLFVALRSSYVQRVASLLPPLLLRHRDASLADVVALHALRLFGIASGGEPGAAFRLAVLVWTIRREAAAYEALGLGLGGDNAGAGAGPSPAALHVMMWEREAAIVAPARVLALTALYESDGAGPPETSGSACLASLDGLLSREAGASAEEERALVAGAIEQHLLSVALPTAGNLRRLGPEGLARWHTCTAALLAALPDLVRHHAPEFGPACTTVRVFFDAVSMVDPAVCGEGAAPLPEPESGAAEAAEVEPADAGSGPAPSGRTPSRSPLASPVAREVCAALVRELSALADVALRLGVPRDGGAGGRATGGGSEGGEPEAGAAAADPDVPMAEAEEPEGEPEAGSLLETERGLEAAFGFHERLCDAFARLGDTGQGDAGDRPVSAARDGLHRFLHALCGRCLEAAGHSAGASVLSRVCGAVLTADPAPAASPVVLQLLAGGRGAGAVIGLIEAGVSVGAPAPAEHLARHPVLAAVNARLVELGSGDDVEAEGRRKRKRAAGGDDDDDVDNGEPAVDTRAAAVVGDALRLHFFAPLVRRELGMGGPGPDSQWPTDGAQWAASRWLKAATRAAFRALRMPEEARCPLRTVAAAALAAALLSAVAHAYAAGRPPGDDFLAMLGAELGSAGWLGVDPDHGGVGEPSVPRPRAAAAAMFLVKELRDLLPDSTGRLRDGCEDLARRGLRALGGLPWPQDATGSKVGTSAPRLRARI